jgi:hypothetical protein
MSRSGDFYIHIANLEVDFLHFLRDLLRAEGFSAEDTIIHPGPGFGRYTPDLTVGNPNGRGKTVVEFKLYRTQKAPTPLLLQAAERVRTYQKEAGASRGLLVVTAVITQAQRMRVEGDGLECWDIGDLKTKAGKSRDLGVALANLLKVAQVGTERTKLSPAEYYELSDAGEDKAAADGEVLAKALEACPSGRAKKASFQFEKLCVQALKLLFAPDFAGWKEQNTIERGYQRLDVIARLTPSNPFWEALAHDFRARYIVFEFKNYTAAISQTEIFTTERYLYPTALRPVAIIIARKGADKNALKTIQGALREHGKLILCITLKELCALLRGWDAGDDPNNLMVAKLDELLMTIAR